MTDNDETLQVGLFVTCLVDLFRPSVGFATVKLLEMAGCRVDVPTGVTCCGQPAYNSGDLDKARDLARAVIVAYEPFDYVVAPSGSCAGMMKHHYPVLFAENESMRDQTERFAAKVFELTDFLVSICKLNRLSSSYGGCVTYHDSCSGLRELGIRQQPRQLLALVDGVELVEMEDSESCCGFGGTFCVKYPEISNAMVEKKVEQAMATGAGLLLGGDLGCLMNIAGKVSRNGESIEARHVAEILAGESNIPPIGGGGDS